MWPLLEAAALGHSYICVNLILKQKKGSLQKVINKTHKSQFWISSKVLYSTNKQLWKKKKKNESTTFMSKIQRKGKLNEHTEKQNCK